MKCALSVNTMLLALAGLVGCSKLPNDGRGQHQAPPQPPDCPSLPELRNLTLDDNSISDVRILTDGRSKFYVPVEWLEGLFEDTGPRLKGDHSYVPRLFKNECPGVVHKGDLVTFLTPPLGLRFQTTGRGWQGSISTSVKNTSEDEILDWPTNEFPTAQVIVGDGKVRVRNPWSKDKAHQIGSSNWMKMRDQASVMVDWLRTAPNDRPSWPDLATDEKAL